MLGIPNANIGFVGFAELDFSKRNTTNAVDVSQQNLLENLFRVRATSCDLKLTQEIIKQNVYDIFYDRNVFHVKPEEIGGSLEYIPQVWCDPGDQLDKTPRLFERSISRVS